MRPEAARHTVARRFDHALAAANAVETSAGKPDIRQTPRRTELAHSIEQHDRKASRRAAK